jgi:hypothetical protein
MGVATDERALGGFSVLLPFFWFAVVAGLLALQMLGTIRVGGDGIGVRWGPFRRFVPYRAMGPVTVDGDSVRIERHSEAPLHFCSVDSAGIARAIEVAKTALHASEATDEADETARGTLSDDEWIAALDRMLPIETGYRDAPFDREGVLAVALDATADPSARAGAAYVLSRAKITSDERAALRSAARVTLHPKVRVVLDEVAEAADESRTRRAMRAVRS